MIIRFLHPFFFFFLAVRFDDESVESFGNNPNLHDETFKMTFVPKGELMYGCFHDGRWIDIFVCRKLNLFCCEADSNFEELRNFCSIRGYSRNLRRLDRLFHEMKKKICYTCHGSKYIVRNF